jgi:hypothetical protein
VVANDQSLKDKALFRLRQAAYGMRLWRKALGAFSELMETALQSSGLSNQSLLRLGERQTGSYDMGALAPTLGRIVCHDVADFVRPVTIRDICRKGRGLCLTADVSD